MKQGPDGYRTAKTSEIRPLFARGSRTASDGLTCVYHAVPATVSEFRFAYAASRARNHVERNRIRRILRAHIRELAAENPPAANRIARIAWIGSPRFAQLPFRTRHRICARLLRKIQSRISAPDPAVRP